MPLPMVGAQERSATQYPPRPRFGGGQEEDELEHEDDLSNPFRSESQDVSRSQEKWSIDAGAGVVKVSPSLPQTIQCFGLCGVPLDCAPGSDV